ncbi:mitochondrial import inner membrane translocase subunit TIM50-C-like isoform X1 [Daktulosphaira vitifoliae]|uniref:mitochondrial import inner membrane translocase subunit TIM50-C-like isoform X1 n=1 Tax=Daktulosphaira vitifoliae TaxID=58002 RepID=UPI0021A995EE|nr:mitochondrial import inner membrane translocase subunit TIM50-C-like isoform X1 [Daktulosphaira vitifoliae]XP_050523864.1 mitochondrial import inner membrane translocase subunit TIM50-C-like isoform X1 [Daktulosphaira vitifoliae]
MNCCNCSKTIRLVCNFKKCILSFPRKFMTSKYKSTKLHITDRKINNLYFNKWIKMCSATVLFSLSTIVGYCLYSLVYEDDDLEIINRENKKAHLIIQMYERLRFRIEFYNNLLSIPVSNKLLPDLPPDYNDTPMHTLVFEMTDILVHAEWNYSTGWTFKKRPNVDYFLEKVGKNFEVIVFTIENGYIAFPILDQTDPLGWIQYRLSRQCAEFHNGHLVKNLKKLNRDLTKVIVIDWNTSWNSLHPRNTLIIPRWNGDDNDNSLIDLADFLTTVFIKDVEDVREVIKNYKQYDDPTKHFRNHQQILKIEKLKSQDMKEEIQKERKSSWFSWISWISWIY